MIITFASSKGGVGKSTTCAALASALALDGSRVLLIDLDQNRTLDRWARKAPLAGLTVSAIEPQKFAGFFRDAESSGNYDHIDAEHGAMRILLVFKASQGFMPRFDGPDMREASIGGRYKLDVFVATAHPPIIDRVDPV